MNLNIPYGWLKEYVATGLAPEEFARRLSEAGMGVERIRRMGELLDSVVVATAVLVKPHPNADRLKIAIVDAGKERFEVVCGGTNLKEGMKVAFAKVGAKVRWHGEGEPIELVPAEIRGAKSFGMICASEEIGLGDWLPCGDKEITDLGWLKAKDGTPLKEALGLDDVIFEVEVTTNRPDALSAIGLAREAAAILDEPLNWKEPALGKRKALKTRSVAAPKVTVKDKTLCPRYQALAMGKVRIAPSPWPIRMRLLAAGVRPIANAVDITNYVMLETGQPMHVFDRAKLAGGEIAVREAKAGERLKALDGRDYELQPGMLVIADKEKPVAIAGVIGGEDSAVGEGTTEVLFEAASFDPVSVRRTARALGLHTESSIRFEKGLSTEATSGALARAAELCRELCGAEPVSAAADVRRAAYKPLAFPFDPAAAEALIGVPVPTREMLRILSALGFKAKRAGKRFKVVVPWWRDHDIEDGRDFSEEVARIHGYVNLPSVLPPGVPPLRERDPELLAEDRLKTLLSGLGALELYTYSFVSERQLASVPVPGVKPVRVANPLTEDFAVMRTSLIPSMLSAIAANQKVRESGDFYEVSRVYLDREGSGLPEEALRAVVACYGDSPKAELFSRAKGYLERIAAEWNAELAVSAGGLDRKVWHPGRSATVTLGGQEAGAVGEVSPDLLSEYGIACRVALLDFAVPALVASERPTLYRPIPQFPPVYRDISFTVGARRAYAEAVAAIRGASDLVSDCSVFDIYEGKGVPEGKRSMAFHLTMSAPERTLTAEEADKAFAAVARALESGLGAEIRK